MGPRKKLMSYINSEKSKNDTSVLKDVVIEGKIGEGQFGQVFRGRWSGIEVALKTVPDNEEPREVSLLQRLRHPNIVAYFGHYTADHLYLVTELCAFGNLRDFVEVRSHTLTTNELLGFSVDAAAGMAYLHSYNIIHRDLAARNLLVAKGPDRFIAKVADFGLSRELNEGYYKLTATSSFSIRWASPEALRMQRWTVKADVWSFGVVLYEIFDFGGLPYAGHSNKEVIDMIIACDLLPQPAACPDNVYALMKNCFRESELLRPTFAELHAQLQGLRTEEPRVEVPQRTRDDSESSGGSLYYYTGGQASAILSSRSTSGPGGLLGALRSSSSEGSRKGSPATSAEEMGQVQRDVLATLLKKLTDRTDVNFAEFYTKLFELNPRLEPLFSHVSTAHQGEKFFQMLLKLASATRSDGDKRTVFDLYELGRRHLRYNIQEDAMLDMRDALVWTLGQPDFLGADFTPQAQDLFIQGFTLTWNIMREGLKAKKESATTPRRDAKEEEPQLPAELAQRNACTLQ